MPATERDWVRALEAARYDIVRREPLLAHKERAENSAFDVHVDASGQIRVVYTRLLETPTKEEIKSSAGRAYVLFRDRNVVTRVNYKLRPTDDLAAVLREIEREIVD